MPHDDAKNDANDAKTMPERCQNNAKKKWRVGSNFYVQKIPIQKKPKIARALSISPNPDASCTTIRPTSHFRLPLTTYHKPEAR